MARSLLPTAAVVLGLSACYAGDLELATNCELEVDPRACWSSHYFRGHEPGVASACTPQPDIPQLSATLELRLFHSAFVDEHGVLEETRRLQRFFEPYGLAFETSAAAMRTDMAYAMSGTEHELDAALDAADLPSDRALDDDEAMRARRAIGSVIFADLRDFVRQHEAPGERRVDLVVLDRVVEPELALALYGTSDAPVVGLGFSPLLLTLLRDGASEGSELHEMIGLDEDFTPILLVGHDDAAGLETAAADNLIAHEMGHALGLPHVSDPHNVMSEFIDRTCVASLTHEQIAQVAPALAPQ